MGTDSAMTPSGFTPGLPVGAHRYARFWERLAAFVIDVVLIAVVTTPLTFVGNIFVAQQPAEPVFVMPPAGERVAIPGSEEFSPSAAANERIDSVLSMISLVAYLAYF